MKKLEKFLNNGGTGILGLVMFISLLFAFIGIFMPTRIITDIFVLLAFLVSSFLLWVGTKASKASSYVELPDDEED